MLKYCHLLRYSTSSPYGKHLIVRECCILFLTVSMHSSNAGCGSALSRTAGRTSKSVYSQSQASQGWSNRESRES